MRIPRLVLPLAASAALLAGCGGGGGGGDTLTASEYKAQATKICTESNKETNALPKPTKAEDVKPFLQKGIDITQKSLDEFSDLKPPEKLEDAHKALVAAEQKGLDKLEEITHSLKGDASDAATVQAASADLDTLSKDVASKARAAGLPKCIG